MEQRDDHPDPGAPLIKAVQRVLGTILGVGVGIAVAHSLIGDHKLIVALALLCDFLAFYAFQTAYSVMMFWITITIMISLLYSLLGLFRPALLEIRLEETVLGAIAGIAAAMLLPMPTGRALGDAGTGFLRALRDALAAIG